MKTNFQKNLLLICTLALGGVAANAGAHDMDRNEGGQFRPVYRQEVIRNYNYVYYPEQQVYYSPEYRTWYWASGNGWAFGANLPYVFNVDLRFGGIPIVLRSPRPYVEHVYVEQTYGRPWRDHHWAYRSERREFEHRDEHREHQENWGHRDYRDRHDQH